MSTFESTSPDNTILFDFLPESNMTRVTRPGTKRKFKPKTNLPAVPNSVRVERSGSVNRAGHHRWPQATMVVKGGNERQVFNTELLTVSTHGNKLDELKNDERSNEEKEGAEPRVILPDISANERTNQCEEEDTNQIPSRFVSKSPSKLSQLPAFSKNLLNPNPTRQDKNHNQKLIKSIKFWRGTTPKLPATNTNSSSEEPANLKSTNAEDTEKNNLSKNDRQQLRLKPNIAPGGRAIPPNMDAQLWKTLIQQHSEKKTHSTTQKPSGVSMSPTQEWKPYIANENAKGQKKPPFFDNANGASDSKKKNLSESNPLPPHTSSTRRSKHQSSSDLVHSNYPVHGEALLKDDKTKTTLPSLNNSSSFPEKEETEHKENEEKNVNSESDDDQKAITRALLVDLKKQLLLKNEQTEEDKSDGEKNEKSSSNLLQGKNGLGMKLKLLLQNSSQHAQQSSNDGSIDTKRQAATARRNARSCLHSQQSGYRPISRPRTIGDGSLPKINNIVSTSLWKRHGINKKAELKNTGTRHRLTLSGVANREVFSSSVIGIAQKHIVVRTKGSESKSSSIDLRSKDGDETNISLEGESKGPLFTLVSNGSSLTKNAKEASDSETLDVQAESSVKSKKKKNPAYRLYTPATIQQHHFSSAASLSKIQEKENPQYKNLKLVTAFANRQKSPPTTPLEQFQVRQQVLKGKSKSKGKSGGKNKVLRISVVEPPLTTKERFARQQQAEKSRKRLTFNPTHAALSNFSTAILNSELDLRAPSSSPVDMFFRSYHQAQPEKEALDYWAMQRQAESQQFAVNAVGGSLDALNRNNQLVNQIDGLMPPRLPVNVEGYRLSDNGEQTYAKPATAPKLKDLVDLQKLYHVMRKHGEAYTNGSAYFYSPSPTAGLDGSGKHLPFKNTANQKSLNKMPFYYYPYHGDTNIQALNEKEGAPLYVVTSANSMVANKTNGRLPGSKKQVRHQVREDFRPSTEDSTTTPFRHVLNLTQNHLPPWNPSKQSTEKNLDGGAKQALTVIMPKTPGIVMPSTLPITQLEQIQEHVIQ